MKLIEISKAGFILTKYYLLKKPLPSESFVCVTGRNDGYGYGRTHSDKIFLVTEVLVWKQWRLRYYYWVVLCSKESSERII